MSSLKQRVFSLQEELVMTRRELHRCPEPGLSEFRTAEIICGHLDEMGIEYTRLEGKTGIVGIIRGAQKGKTIAFRADMDGLPITEANETAYTSVNSGYMHACGHDAHVAILLGTAKILQTLVSRLNGSIKLFFEPAEETAGGAQNMVKLGCMENPKVEAVFGLHVDPLLPCGAVQTRFGVLNGSSDALHFTVRGRSAHGAYPDTGVDAIVVAAHLVTALQTLVSRGISPLDSVSLSIGTIHGGTAENVLAGEVKLRGTLRTISPATRHKAKEQIRTMLQSVCTAFGAQGNVVIEDGYRALVNNSAMTERVLQTASRLLGSDCVLLKEHPSLGVEDFSCFLDAAPGAFFHLGCRNEDKGFVSALHSDTFDIDEACLPVGVLVESGLALCILNEDLLDELTR